MASDPTEVATNAYISYVKERGHAPKRTVHLFNWCKFHQPPLQTKFCNVKQVLSNPPDVSEFLKATSAQSSDLSKAVMNSLSSRKTTAELYQQYCDEHDGKHPSTVARFQHFCEAKGSGRSYAECSIHWVQQQHLHRGHTHKRHSRHKRRKQKQRFHDPPQKLPQGEPRVAVVLSMADLEKQQNKQRLEVAAAQEEKHEEYKVPGIDSYVMDEAHVKKEVKEHTSEMQLPSAKDGEPAACLELMKVFEAIEISDDQLAMWASYGGGRLFPNKEGAGSRLRTVLQYVATNKRCSEHIRHKMAVITKLILDKGLENKDEYVHILLLLASHGNVCNVMKEVAIGNAYGILTDKMDDFVQQQTLEQQLLKVLRDFRVLKVETLFHAFKMTNNTHYIAGFHNVLAPNIGVIPYNDEHISTPSTSKCKDWKKSVDKRYFAEYYTAEQVLDHVLEQISEKKISYQKVVRFLEDVCPKDVKKMNFLQSAIDIDTGKINKAYIAFMLSKFGILMPKPDDYKPVEKDWLPIEN